MTALPTLQPAASSTPATPGAVVETFLAALVANDVTRAIGLLDDDVEYTNVGLPTVRGAHRVRSLFAPLAQRGRGFEAYLHTVATSGDTVLTERTDVLVLGPVRLQFWVAGRFDVRDGKITLWRDSFDYVDVLRSLGRGLVGALIPALTAATPGAVRTPPGRARRR